MNVGSDNQVDAEILTVWDGLSEVVRRVGGGFAAAPLDFDKVDSECEQAARLRSEQGAVPTRNAGLNACARVVKRDGSIWETILEQADQIQADAVVVGSRGLTGLKSLLLGSVSHGVLEHADRPVIVVPAQETAERRSRRLIHRPRSVMNP